MKTQITELLKDILKQLGITGIEPEVEISEDPKHGDYTTNVAMKAMANVNFKLKTVKWKTPFELALQVVEKFKVLSLQFKLGESNQNIPQISQISPISQTSLKLLQAIELVEAVPPGFINIFLTEAKLSSRLEEVLKEKESYGKAKKRSDLKEDQGLTSTGRQKRVYPERAPASRRVMVEFAHPNTHKAFHIGHLRNISTGESIVRLLESQGIEVIRANYQGDVGMHIAKCLYALSRISNIKDQISNIKTKTVEEKVDFLGKAYAVGNKAFEDPSADGEEAKKQTGEINKKIYAKDPEIFPLYQETRQWSLDYFDGIYKRVGSHFDRFYFESEVFESGKKYVLEALKKGIFVESEGAIIFPGEKYGLHNRVFITQEGNATYEGKDVGLVRLQLDEYHPDLIIHVVGPEQAGYFEVLFKALEQLFPETKGKEYHLIYGWVRLKRGKMSSRAGNVITGECLLDEAKQSIYSILEKSISKGKEEKHKSNNQAGPVSHLPGANSFHLEGVEEDKVSQYSPQEKDDIAEKAAVAAVKYAFLRVSTKQEIAFDLKESVSFEGDSGPYLQYTYARAKSVLRKASEKRKVKSDKPEKEHSALSLIASRLSLNPEERSVLRLIHFFPEIVAEAASTYSPNIICNYLFKLAQAFNLFYQKHTILNAPQPPLILRGGEGGVTTSNLRLALTAATAQVIKNGLYLMGIATVERM